MRQKYRPDEVKIPSGRIENNLLRRVFAKNYCYIDFLEVVVAFFFLFLTSKTSFFFPFSIKKSSKSPLFCHSDRALSFRQQGEIALVALVCCSRYVIFPSSK
jgi:hypothetical protein